MHIYWAFAYIYLLSDFIAFCGIFIAKRSLIETSEKEINPIAILGLVEINSASLCSVRGRQEVSFFPINSLQVKILTQIIILYVTSLTTSLLIPAGYWRTEFFIKIISALLNGTLFAYSFLPCKILT